MEVLTSPRLVVCRRRKDDRVSSLGEHIVENPDVDFSPAIIIREHGVDALSKEGEKAKDYKKRTHCTREGS